MKYIYSTSQMSKLSLTLRTFSITSSVAGLFLTCWGFDCKQVVGLVIGASPQLGLLSIRMILGFKIGEIV